MVHQRWVVLAVVFVARTSMGYQFQSFGSVGPLLVAQLAIDFALLGALIGLYKLPGVIFALPSGMLGRRFGEKSMLVLGAAMMASGGFLIGTTEVLEVVYLGRIISGVGAVLFNVLSAKMIADWFAEQELTLALSCYVNSWPLGIALGLATQAALAESLSVNWMFCISALFCALGLVLLVVGSKDRSATPPADFAHRVKSQFTSRELVLVSLAAFVWLLFNANLVLVVSFAPAFLISAGYDVQEAGLLTSLGTWFGILAIPVGGLIVHWGVSADRFVYATLLVGFAATLSIVWFDYPTLAFIVFGLFAWAPAGAIFALPVSVLQKENRAVGMGFYLSFYYLGLGVFSPIAGFLRDTTADPTAPIIFAASLLIGALAALLAFRTFERRGLLRQLPTGRMAT